MDYSRSISSRLVLNANREVISFSNRNSKIKIPQALSLKASFFVLQLLVTSFRCAVIPFLD